MTADTSYTLGEIAEYLELECTCDPSIEISGIANLQEARAGQLSFLFDPTYRRYLSGTSASVVILSSQDAENCSVNALIADDPRLAFARVTKLFEPVSIPEPGIEKSAEVSSMALVGENVYIGPHAVVEEQAVIESGVIIGAGCVIGARCRIGKNTRLLPNVTLYHDVDIGNDTTIHSGVVIGADGFGFTFDFSAGRMQKIHQVYGVRIGADVEIGAGTTIDRGALNDTVIGDGVKLDNQVQVGHGTTIGDHTAISGCTAIAGSVRIGSYCLIGGAVGIINNLEISDRVEITAMTLVSQSILKSGRYSSGTGLLPSRLWKRSIVGFRKLDGIIKQLRNLEGRISNLDQQDGNQKK
jgi:UDP-3-O-[3-hydroxymyristoyl] glucosamine N-acyltransferase